MPNYGIASRIYLPLVLLNVVTKKSHQLVFRAKASCSPSAVYVATGDSPARPDSPIDLWPGAKRPQKIKGLKRRSNCGVFETLRTVPGEGQEFFRRFHFLTQRKVAIAGLRAHSKSKRVSPSAASPSLAWRCFQPSSNLGKGVSL